MLHSISTESFGPLGEPMAKAVSACVHCGFCLAACPTYRELGQEMDSPRGRIVLMKEVLEGTLELAAAQPHLDRCLGCLACEPACPSGVPYRDLISPFRAVTAGKMYRSPGEKVRRFLAGTTLPFPARFRLAAMLGKVARASRFRRWVPRSWHAMLDLVPETLPAGQSWPEVNPAIGKRRARVALLLGCAQRVLDPDINTSTIEVLTRNGVEVLVPRAQGCCGGLAWHTGDLPAARRFARRNLLAFPADVDAIVTNAAGCGSAMQEYHLILRGTGDEELAEAFRHRVQDVSLFLVGLGLREPLREMPLTLAYHDACHLANAQEVRRQPRDLLRSIPGLNLVEITDAQYCCGSAGTYNLEQPGIAAALGAQKARAILATGADVVASGNIGCLTQLRLHLRQLGSPMEVRHTIQVLRDAHPTFS
ncbi:MAG: (Fe-S)-binding protein [Verrucomicrobiales bacterium]|nr:4Fe-4S dicluster domain-containing protein [Verrucomicrobiae bacterium]MCP5552371.1 4Fe-4S dicluster domain-containing protein [Akkermansiaceae bacterium]